MILQRQSIQTGTWDFEDEYSHNHIDKDRDKFIDTINEYFKENNLLYVMREVCGNTMICGSAMVCDKNGEILKRGK